MIYEALKDNDAYLGEAWFNMESYVETATFVEQRYPNRDPHTECAGNNLIGNPFLYVHYTGDSDTDNIKFNENMISIVVMDGQINNFQTNYSFKSWNEC